MIERFIDGVISDACMVYGAGDTMGDLTTDLLGTVTVFVGACLYF